MLIVGLNPAHDGAVAVVEDRQLLFSLESEKDSYPRHSTVVPDTILAAAELAGEMPDVIALGGWGKNEILGRTTIGAGYPGVTALEMRPSKFFGRRVNFFTSSHERSHIAMAAGMGPREDVSQRAVLVWEGLIGAFYLLDDQWRVSAHFPCLHSPGSRFAFLFALANPAFPDYGLPAQIEDAGKLMALAAFGDPDDCDARMVETVERMLSIPVLYPAPKSDFRDSPFYNVGVEAEVTKAAAALLTERIFEIYADCAREHLPAGLPLYISGGCGLNCDWNVRWRDFGQFSSVFVPPCASDSGSALGTAIDALMTLTGDGYIDWDVYCGLEFEWDAEPDPARWGRQELDYGAVASAIAEGRIFAWVQGRWEMGPRALGNRSILAEPFEARTRDRLNEIKQREDYRPIAPCAREEDLAQAFDSDFIDPYMLYFRHVRAPLAAISHVDGTARAQTVSAESNPQLHELLSAFAAQSGIGVLCNTSLNFKGFGFMNRMSDLAKYCETRGIDDMVVGDIWFSRDERQRITTIRRKEESLLHAGHRAEA